MKTKRNELVQNLALNREQVAKLNALKSSYKYEKTQQFVGKQAQALQVQGQGLEKLLNEIDASIEISIAAKEMNLADAGGLKSSESQKLLKQAETLIQQSKALSDDVGMLFSVKQGEDPIPRTNDASANSRSAPPNSSGGDPRNTPHQPQSGPVAASSWDRGNSKPSLTSMQGERFPETRNVEVNPARISMLSMAQLDYAINEMFARHGATFNDPAIASFFRDKPWYFARAGRSPSQIENSLFSDTERRNFKILYSERERRLATSATVKLEASPNDAAEFQPRLPQSAVIDDQDGWSNLRAEPNRSSRVVCRIYQGAPFVVTQSQDKWYWVTTRSGENGWIHRSVVRFTSQN